MEKFFGEVTLPYPLEVWFDVEAFTDAGEGTRPGEAGGDAVICWRSPLIEAGMGGRVVVAWVSRCEGLGAGEVDL